MECNVLGAMSRVQCAEYTGGGGGTLQWVCTYEKISKWVYFACSPEFAVGNFAPICCEPAFGRLDLPYYSVFGGV